MNQQDHDRRSLELHRHVAAKLRAEPDALERVRATFQRWQASTSRADVANERWRALLDVGEVEAIVAAALDPSPEGDQLRQSSPLITLLDPRERWALLRALRRSDAA